MENHPHDSICGCSIDQVHDEMKVRFDQVEQIGDELTQQSLERLAAGIDTRAHSRCLKTAVVVFNPSHSGAATVEVEIVLPPDSAEFEITSMKQDMCCRTKPWAWAHRSWSKCAHVARGATFSLGMISEGRMMGLGIRTFRWSATAHTATLDVILSEQNRKKRSGSVACSHVLALLADPTLTAFHVRARTADVIQAAFSAPASRDWAGVPFMCAAKEIHSAPLAIPPLASALLPFAGNVAGTSPGAEFDRPLAARSVQQTALRDRKRVPDSRGRCPPAL